MVRLCLAIALGVLLGAENTASAQRGGPPSDVKKLEADLAKLRAHMENVALQLKKAKEAEAKKKDRQPSRGGPAFGGRGGRGGRGDMGRGGRGDMGRGGRGDWGRGGWGGWGGFDPARMKEVRERFEKMRADAKKKGDRGKGTAQRGPRGFWGKIDANKMKAFHERMAKWWGEVAKKKGPQTRKLEPSSTRKGPPRGPRGFCGCGFGGGFGPRGGFSPRGGFGGMGPRGSSGGPGKPAVQSKTSSNIEERLERLIREVEALKRDLRRR